MTVSGDGVFKAAESGNTPLGRRLGVGRGADRRREWVCATLQKGRPGAKGTSVQFRDQKQFRVSGAMGIST